PVPGPEVVERPREDRPEESDGEQRQGRRRLLAEAGQPQEGGRPEACQEAEADEQQVTRGVRSQFGHLRWLPARGYREPCRVLLTSALDEVLIPATSARCPTRSSRRFRSS